MAGLDPAIFGTFPGDPRVQPGMTIEAIELDRMPLYSASLITMVREAGDWGSDPQGHQGDQ
jgi:hypothetical protein